MGGCLLIVAFVLSASEVYLEWTGRSVRDGWLQSFFLVRGTVASGLLAAYAGWYVWRTRRRIESVRETLRARELEVAAREQRVEQGRAVDAAAQVLAHEIRNPINNVLLHCTLLERGSASLSADTRSVVERTLAVLRSEAMRLSELVDAYVGGRKVELRRMHVDLHAIARETLDVYRATVERRRIRARVDGGRTALMADPSRIRQALHNMLRNALEAVADGGEIFVRCTNEGRYAAVCVFDDGPGFADTSAAFRPFYTTKEHGTGLGLAVVRDVARMHGGQVEAANRPEGGARVALRLPMGDEA